MKPWFSLFLRRMLQIRRDFLTTCTQKSTRGAKLQADTVLCTKNERPQNRTDAKPCLSDVYKMSTRAKRRQTDVRLSGRSMVEMLGVLAIIGVLSVGAMNGYSKAMFKYKLNKQAEQIGQIIDQLQVLNLNLSKENFSDSFVNVLDKLGIIPSEMVRSDGIYDVFGNQISLYVSSHIQILIPYHSFDVCLNLVNIAKAHSDYLWQINLRIDFENDYSYQNRIMGDKYCGGDYACIRTMTLDDIKTFCDTCNAENIIKCQFSYMADYQSKN